MTDDLSALLADDDTRRGLENGLRELIRAGAFDELEERLTRWDDRHPSRFSPLWREVAADDVAITGWDQLHADIQELTDRGKQVTAVGIDLTGHAEGDGPAFEVSYYDDGPYSFSTASRDDMLRENESYGTRWAGGFIDIESPLSCSGLERLHEAVMGYADRHWLPRRDEAPPTDFAGYTLAIWALYSRVHQAIKRALRKHGMPRPMPVLVEEHDFGPWLGSVYLTGGAADGTAASRIVAERRAATKAHRDQVTEQLVAEFTEKRAAMRAWPRWWRPAKRATSQGLLKAQEFLGFGELPSPPTRSITAMPDGAFEDLLRAFRRHRDPEGNPDAVRSSPGTDRTDLHHLFMNHARRFGGPSVRRAVRADSNVESPAVTRKRRIGPGDR